MISYIKAWPRSLLGPLFLTLSVSSSFADDGYRALFSAAASSLPESDQKAIYTLLDLSHATDGSGFVLEGCPSAKFEVELLDLNGDGVPEVFLRGGNSCTSGIAGESVWLFTKIGAGRYKMHFGFPAINYKALPEKSAGYPNIRFSIPGFCEPVWRWNGNEYKHFRNIPTSRGGCKDA